MFRFTVRQPAPRDVLGHLLQGREVVPVADHEPSWEIFGQFEVRYKEYGSENGSKGTVGLGWYGR